MEFYSTPLFSKTRESLFDSNKTPVQPKHSFRENLSTRQVHYSTPGTIPQNKYGEKPQNENQEINTRIEQDESFAQSVREALEEERRQMLSLFQEQLNKERSSILEGIREK